jgi:transcriptional regulator with PAS, ATPase and Fis domain
MDGIGNAFYQLFNDVYSMRCFLLSVQIFSFVLKSFFLFHFCNRLINTKKIHHSWFYLLVVLSCSTFEDLTWIVSLLHKTKFLVFDYRIVIWLIRITWSTNILMYQSFALFIESFTSKINRISSHQIFFSFISGAFFLCPIGLMFWTFNTILTRPAFEYYAYTAETVYALCFLMPFTLFYSWRKLQKTHSQKILKTQLKTTISFFILPHVIINLYHTFPLTATTGSQSSTVLATACSNIFLTVSLFYCLHKIIRLRFLNFHKHVHSSDNFNFVNNFKTILELLGSATSANEVQLLTQRFFSQIFRTPTASVSLTIRSTEAYFNTEQQRINIGKSNSSIEHFLGSSSNKNNAEVLNYLNKEKILIYDEVEYDDFYNSIQPRKIILAFLEEIQVDLFLPIYEQNNIVGYITVERHARGTELYSNIERDEMIVFASFLSKVINLLQNRNLQELLKERKNIIEELYQKHQEINQYKESIRSFLNNSERGIGIIFYKNRKFMFANQDARDLIEMDPNQQEGHPLTKALKALAKQTFIYKTNTSQLTKSPSGKEIVLASIPQIEHNNVIIIVYCPEMYDTIKQQIDAIRDPSDWDYLLYLETTRSGKLINELIPSNGKVLLNFKIDLLKLALGKKALLLDLPEDDLIPLVELIHHISLRETLHILDLKSHVSNADTAIRLFGINPLYGSNTAIPLLQKLNKQGTLVIKNIHLLDRESQENLAQFIRYGFYTIFKSEKRVQSDVRIICSTHQDLAPLVQEGQFSRALFNELNQETLVMPQLLTLSHQEINQLVDGFTDQAMTTHEFKSLISLSNRDRDYIAAQRPISLQELKNRVQQLLVHKSKKTGVYHETQFNTAYNITDPKLVEAARLGKHALKDPKLLQLLWNKFKSQNKIALFLDVNRSSVYRRCKEHGIG